MVKGASVADKERIVFRVEGGEPDIISRASFDGDIPLAQLDNKVETFEHVKDSTLFSAAPGTVAASFRRYAGRQSVLRVENGLDHPILYEALIATEGPSGIRTSRTSICPVAAGKAGFESWPGNVVAVVITRVNTPAPGDMRCSGDSGLVSDSGLAPANICRGGRPGDPVSVDLSVDPATGQRREAHATWTLRNPVAGEWAPWLLLTYPMQGEAVGGRPIAVTVAGIVPLTKIPPSRSASIVLLANGREISRRSWQLYAKQRAEVGNLPVDKRPIAFFGLVPFPFRDEASALIPSMSELVEGVGAATVKAVEVRIVGDDGFDLGHATFSLASPPVQDRVQVTAALMAAEAQAAAPGHCREAAP